MISECIICKNMGFVNVFSINRVPVCGNAPIKEDDIKNEVFGELDIVMCRRCSHVFNKRFSQKIIDSMYYKEYSSGIALTKGVTDRYDKAISEGIKKENIVGKSVIEIGASNFSFSNMMLALGAKEILAFEPSSLFESKEKKIMHIKKYFSRGLIPHEFSPGLIVARHVLEHMTAPMAFIKELSESSALGTKVYIEVPNVDDIIENKRIYDFFYEHVSYFSPGLLSSVLESVGFKILSITPLADHQHFGILSEKISKGTDIKAKMINTEVRVNKLFKLGKSKEEYLQKLNKIICSSKNVAIYGAGNHSIASVVMLGDKSSMIGCMLDINPIKAGLLSPMNHIKIMIPSKALVSCYDAIIIIAALHQEEIYNNLRDKYGFSGKIFGTYPIVSELK